MYKLMLVDDEPEICQGLQKVVDFAALGYEVVGEARNGMEALQIAEEVRPDLVITDIRMPVMDGLTMATRMKKTLPTVRFIILSGYDEFEYAQKAIEVTALRYLLKPISSKEIIAILQEVRVILDEEFSRVNDTRALRAIFHASLPLLKEALLASLVSGSRSIREIREAAERYDMALDAQGYALAFIRLPTGRQETRGLAIDDPELASFAIENIVGEVLDGHVRHHLFHHDGMLAVLMLLEDDAFATFAIAVDAFEEARQNILHFLALPTQIGISAKVPALADVPVCAKQALSALGQAVFTGESQVLCANDILPSRGQPILTDEYALRLLANSLKLGEAENARAAVSQLMEGLRRQEATMQDYRTCLLEILLAFLRTARELGIALPQDGTQSLIDQVIGCPTLEQAKAALLALCGTFTAALADNKASSTRMFAQQAIEFLNKNYMQEDLTIDKVCGHLHISTSYFSALFKKETHRTFLQYLTEIRMDRAMTLLAGTDMKTIEVAQQVGIADPSYFSHIFKKHFSLSPSQARRGKE